MKTCLEVDIGMRKLFDQDEVAESEWKELPEEDGEVCSEGHQHSEKGGESKMKKKLCLRVFQKNISLEGICPCQLTLRTLTLTLI